MLVHLDHETPAAADDPEPASSAEEPPERSGEVGRLIVDLCTSSLTDAKLGHSSRTWLTEHVVLVANRLGVEGELRIRVVDDDEMARAHERHMGDPTTTDVMTFDLAEGAAERGAPVDADLLVCLDEAARNARERGHAVERELLLYIVHGMLHCLGHDDHDESSYQRMHALEDELLEAIGVGATFRPATGGRPS
ncbi:MAG: rRNA maturation RNase YbeY [Phycisphaerales bacterium]